MATVINNPDTGAGSGGGVVGTVIAVLVVAILAVLLFVYGLPAIRGGNNTGGTNVTVPEKVQLDVNTPTNK